MSNGRSKTWYVQIAEAKTFRSLTKFLQRERIFQPERAVSERSASGLSEFSAEPAEKESRHRMHSSGYVTIAATNGNSVSKKMAQADADRSQLRLSPAA